MMAEVEKDSIPANRPCSPTTEVSDAIVTTSLNGSEDGEDEGEIMYASADYTSVGEDQISFHKGQPLRILTKSSEHWWWAESQGTVGYVPVNHLSLNSLQQFYWEDEEYFGSYGKLKLHHEMLSDRPRTLAYQHAIKDNAHLLKDKVILDVGCGTGILSLMCAKYGKPKQVYAVEASEFADYTSEIVRSNSMSDIIEVKHSYVEDLSLDQSVDLIISEWMGTLLLFEMMIESVLIARDKFLRPGGMVWPSSASLFLVPATAAQQYNDCVDFWCDQYGFDLSCLKSLAFNEFLHKPDHSFTLDRENCLAVEWKLFELDMRSVSVSDFEEIASPFEFHITKCGVLHGFCTWFQVDFMGLSSDIATTVLNTGPDHEPTHWKQNLFMLDAGLTVNRGDTLHGQTKIYRHPEWRRHLRMSLTFTHVCSGSKQSSDYEKVFHVWR